MYNEFVKNHLFSSRWRNSVTHLMIDLISHVACLNVVRNHLH